MPIPPDAELPPLPSGFPVPPPPAVISEPNVDAEPSKRVPTPGCGRGSPPLPTLTTKDDVLVMPVRKAMTVEPAAPPPPFRAAWPAIEPPPGAPSETVAAGP